jgi:hypothetical protein
MRRKSADSIRRDALGAARRKLDEGCSTCAQGYARVAASHGATRRDFIKAGIGTLASVVVAVAGVTSTGVTTAQADFYTCVPVDGWCWFGQWLEVYHCCWNWECWFQVEETGFSC